MRVPSGPIVSHQKGHLTDGLFLSRTRVHAYSYSLSLRTSFPFRLTVSISFRFPGVEAVSPVSSGFIVSHQKITLRRGDFLVLSMTHLLRCCEFRVFDAFHRHLLLLLFYHKRGQCSEKSANYCRDEPFNV